MSIIAVTFLISNITQEKILHTRRPKLSFSRTTRCTVKASQLLFLLFTSEMKNKENHHGGFHQQNTQAVVNTQKHTSSRNDRWMVRLKVVPLAQFFVRYSIQQSNAIMMTFDFDQLRLFRQEWSVSPSIFNIKARGLAHCLL